MKLHDLKPNPGSHKKRTRVGRGISAGQGKTAGRGTKGQNSRSGGSKANYFEGGQLPLVRRLPFKRGFTNIFRTVYQEINIGVLSAAFKAGDTVNPKILAEMGLIIDADKPVVVLGDGELTVTLNVASHRFTTSAREKIEKAGGTVKLLKIGMTGALATVKLLPKDKRSPNEIE